MLQVITNAKGKKLGYVAFCPEHTKSSTLTTVYWMTGEGMSFIGDAGILFGEMVVEVENGKLVCPKSLVKQVKKETRSLLMDLYNAVFWVFDMSSYSNKLDFSLESATPLVECMLDSVKRKS